MKELIVLKYGGSSLADPEKILSIAKNLGKLHDKGQSVIVVVSAMGKGTDRLIDLAHQVSKTPARREMDMLLSTGERISMSLMSIALQSLNYPAISFTGSQSGILTTQTHNKAKIIDVKPLRIRQALQEKKIVIVAGFQGVDPITKEITTLGRGGSDTTAVTLAAHFQASSCQTLKDVSGVYSIDPRLSKTGTHIKNISFASLKSMCFWGSPILHYRSVALAEKMNVPLYIGHSFEHGEGTTISKEAPSMYEQTDILSVNIIKKIIHLSVETEDTNAGYELLSEFLNKHSLAMPQVLASAYDKTYLRLMLTDSDEALSAISEHLKSEKNIELMNEDNSVVSLTFNGAVDTEIIPKASQLLKQKNINVSKVLTSALAISLVVKANEVEASAKTLHQLVNS